MKRWIQVIFGIIVGIVGLEIIFAINDDWAFPHVNIYKEDAELGLRLEPNTSQYLKIHTNPRTSLRTNSQGYRGEEFPSTSADEIIIVGDSQVFGLGVEENQTFSAQLQKMSGRTVINAGVPTYGPPEYTHIAKELIQKRKPKTLIYTINLVNDLFEYKRSNRERHQEWDGWAVRSETAPDQIQEFPGRKWLFQKSHLIYAARKYLRYQEEVDSVMGLPSEGLWDDLLDVNAVMENHNYDKNTYPDTKSKLQETKDKIENLRLTVKAEMAKKERSLPQEQQHLLKASKSKPGDVIDIVQDQYIEEGRPIVATTEMINKGIVFRKKFMERLKTENREEWEKLEKMLAEEKDLQQKKRDLILSWTANQNIPSSLFGTLEEINTYCTENNVEFILLLLPIDVQVSEQEWEKYPYPAQNMSSSLQILEDILKDSQRLHRKAANPLTALRSIQPLGFLDGDIHMDPAGHEHVAKVLWETIQAPIEPKFPSPGIPQNRTWVPSAKDWHKAPSRVITTSTCLFSSIEEWVRVYCNRAANKATDIRIQGGHGEAMTAITEDGVNMVAPILPGEEIRAQFFWKDMNRTLVIRRSKEYENIITTAFEEKQESGVPLSIDKNIDSLCSCFKQEMSAEECSLSQRPSTIGLVLQECVPRCDTLFVRNSDRCMQEESCAKKLDCAMGAPWALPDCPLGQINAGANGSCLTLCDEDNPCEQGDCQPWQGAGICY